MQVAVGVGGEFVVDDHGQFRDVEAAGGDVGRDQHRGTVVGETHQHFLALALFEFAMHGQHREPPRREFGRHRAHLLACVAEHDGRGRPVFEQQRTQGRSLLRGLHLEEQLRNLGLRVGVVNGDCERPALQATADAAHALGNRCREQQGLPACRQGPDDGVDDLEEAHVEHAVGLVEHQHLHGFQRQRALFQQLLHAPRRTDDHMRLMRERRQLRTQRNAAAERQHLHVGQRARQPPDFPADLVRQFPRRAQHEALQRGRGGIQRRQQAEREGCGLAAAGVCLRDDVAAGEDAWQARGLYRRHFDVFDVGQSLDQRRGKVQFGKQHRVGGASRAD